MGTVVELRPVFSAPVAKETLAKRVTMDDGYTRIAHGIVEELMQSKYKLSGREYVVLMVVIRKTYGYRKSEDWIALSQFVESTGLDKCSCQKVIKGLAERKIITRKVQGNDQKLAINTNVSDWLPERPGKKAETAKRTARKARKSNPTINKSNPTTNKSNPTTNQHNPTPTKDKDINNNILKDCVPTSVETLPIEKQVEQENHIPDAAKMVSNEPTPVKQKNKTLKFTPEDRQFAQYMAERIDAVNGLSDKRRNLDNWANQLRLMREADDRSPEDIARVFNWANQDLFWQSNIQSPEKLRKQFIRLHGECRKSNHFGASSHENHRATGQQHFSQQEYIDDLGWMEEL